MTTVLVIDDDIELLEMVTLVLERHSYTVHSISDAGNLIQAIESASPQVVLMDIFLGDADGRKLCYDLKKSQDHKKLPVILYSAANVSGDSIDESLADGFLAKPFNIEHLTATIDEVVSRV